MKKVLVVGEKSYLGIKFKEYITRTTNSFLISTVSLRNDSWKKMNFSEYDVVFHVVGIAHIKETKKNKPLYYKINRDLAYEVAKKSKKDGVGHFIFLSSMSVYGMKSGVIKDNTIPNPISNYGKSKLQAEELIKSLSSASFKISIIRPPMIYGPRCKGNYSKLALFSLKTIIFPYIENKRSMLYVDHFSEFIKLIIENGSSGMFFPQNSEYVCTTKMVSLIAQANGRTIFLTKMFNPLLNLFKSSALTKIFGNLVYEREMSEYTSSYSIYDFEETINLTEKVNVNE
ncbi:NAD-dependent epimerase/dehydratase family protein [Exiguobacterium sp. s56]|uniref:NAD-dependent epimerase/dehydratase family protein n=1 Tax=Exiguobacterium sp. s56 TaxID=2751232 RepID=UPI001BEB8C49|nr:NAD-dependent epimerase/dehydratase family protein [Exiguobacterium sp. s56]